MAYNKCYKFQGDNKIRGSQNNWENGKTVKKNMHH